MFTIVSTAKLSRNLAENRKIFGSDVRYETRGKTKAKQYLHYAVVLVMLPLTELLKQSYETQLSDIPSSNKTKAAFQISKINRQHE